MNIYFDANAASRLRPVAVHALEQFLGCSADLGNPSSIHTCGRRSRGLLEQAREQVSGYLLSSNRSRHKVIFTSGGTESCNTMIRGFMGRDGGKVVCSAIEHPAVSQALLSLNGNSLVQVPVTADGVVDIEAFSEAVTTEVELATLMFANNETGVVQPVEELVRLLRSRGWNGAFVVDAIQAVGKSDFDAVSLFECGVDAIAVSGSKLGSGFGAGAVLVNGGSESTCRLFRPLLLGGVQESGFRAGSPSLAAIVAFGAVCDYLAQAGQEERERITSLRDELWQLLSDRLPFVRRVVRGQSLLSNTLLVSVQGCRGDDLVVGLDLEGVMVSTGAACASGKQQTSHVLRAMGMDDQEARQCIRVSLDWDASTEIICKGVERVERVTRRMREKALCI